MTSFIDRLVAEIEAPDEGGTSLAARLRQSHDPTWGAWDGALVDEMADLIDRILDKMSAEEARREWNVVAEMQGCDPLEEGEVLAGRYSDMFINPLLDAISPTV